MISDIRERKKHCMDAFRLKAPLESRADLCEKRLKLVVRVGLSWRFEGEGHEHTHQLL